MAIIFEYGLDIYDSNDEEISTDVEIEYGYEPPDPGNYFDSGLEVFVVTAADPQYQEYIDKVDDQIWISMIEDHYDDYFEEY